MEGREPKPGEIYVHYKNPNYLYRINNIAFDTDDITVKRVNYTSLYDKERFAKGTCFSRRLEEFMEDVEIDGKKVPRFRLVEQS